MDTLRRLRRMMKRLKPYLPKPKPMPEPKRAEWQIDDSRVIKWPPKPARQ